MTSVTVSAEVDMCDIETEYLVRELERRNQEYTSRFTLLSEQDVIPIINKVRFALYNKDEAKILEASKEYFYERYNILG